MLTSFVGVPFRVLSVSLPPHTSLSAYIYIYKYNIYIGIADKVTTAWLLWWVVGGERGRGWLSIFVSVSRTNIFFSSFRFSNIKHPKVIPHPFPRSCTFPPFHQQPPTPHKVKKSYRIPFFCFFHTKRSPFTPPTLFTRCVFFFYRPVKEFLINDITLIFRRAHSPSCARFFTYLLLFFFF